MAKASVPGKKEDKYPYSSRFGSTSSMIVSENDDGTVICKDEFGEYKTERDKLDTNMADQNRFSLTSRKQNYV